MDNFQILVVSSSWYRNARLLEEEVGKVTVLTWSLWLSFSVGEMELIHWQTWKERWVRTEEVVTIQCYISKPGKKAVKWLGFWLLIGGEIKTYFTKRLTLMQGAFIRIQRLSAHSKGPSPYMMRRLPKGIILPMILYGAEILEPKVTMMRKMQMLWNRVLRWITNLFHETNVTVLSVKACLAPVRIYAEQMRRIMAIKITTTIPENNIAMAMVPGRCPFWVLLGSARIEGKHLIKKVAHSL